MLNHRLGLIGDFNSIEKQKQNLADQIEEPQLSSQYKTSLGQNKKLIQVTISLTFYSIYIYLLTINSRSPSNMGSIVKYTNQFLVHPLKLKSYFIV